MMVRRKNDSEVAVMEPPARPEDIAARVAQADIDARKSSAVADIERWRQIVHQIADGTEPDGKSLAAMGDLNRRLRLPPDSVAQAVRAIHASRKHDAEVDRVRDELVRIKSREPELAAEIKAAEQRVRELHAQVLNYQGIQAGYPYSVQAANAVRQENPLIFAEVEHVAQRLVAAESGMASGTIKGMIPQPERLEGNFTKSGWRG
jgi:hypothetical protein